MGANSRHQGCTLRNIINLKQDGPLEGGDSMGSSMRVEGRHNNWLKAKLTNVHNLRGKIILQVEIKWQKYMS